MGRLTAGALIKSNESTNKAVSWSVFDSVTVLFGTQFLTILVGVVVYSVAQVGSGDRAPFWVTAMIWPAIWIGYAGGTWMVSATKGGGIRADFGTRCNAFDAIVGAVLGVGLQLLIIPLLYWPILRFVDADPSRQAKEHFEQVGGVGQWVMLVMAVVVMAPLVEELFFRGLMLRSLEHRFGRVAAVLVSSGVFALVHFDWILVPGLFAFGLVTSMVVLFTGRLGMAVALHMGFNLTTVVLLGWQSN